MLQQQPCPKCGGLSWYEQLGKDIVQKCLCGLHRFVWTFSDGGLIRHRVPKAEMTLPQQGTKLFATLEALATYYPKSLMTQEVSGMTKHTIADTASELMVLDHKGLVDKIEERKGVQGGSLWGLSAQARRLLNID